MLPTAGGQVPGGFSGWINGSAAGIPNSIWALIALVAVWLWFRRTRAARRIYAVGSDREAARIAGVRIVPTLVTAYAISGLCAGGAALFYTMLTASGDPTSGDGLILPSVAAVVIGGTSLFGGQGSFVGTVAGALTLTLLARRDLRRPPAVLLDRAGRRPLAHRRGAGGHGTAGPAGPAGGRRRMTAVTRSLSRNRAILFGYLLVVVLAIAGEIVSSGFLRINHIDELIITGGFIALVGVGQTFVILTGGVDLSIPWVLNASAVFLTLWAKGDSAKMVWIVPVLLGGAAVIGAVNGIGVAFLRIPPIIMTLGMSSVVEGGLLLVTNGGSGQNAPGAAVYLATHRWGPVPVLAVLWLAVLIASTVILAATPFGRRLYATGLNRRVAAFAGVNTQLVTVDRLRDQQHRGGPGRYRASRLRGPVLLGHGRSLPVRLGGRGGDRRDVDPGRFGQLRRHHGRGAGPRGAGRAAPDPGPAAGRA